MVDLYYFDGHGGITDPDSVWSNDSNAFDGSTSTFASCASSGSSSSNYLQGIGTTAPLLNVKIHQVRARIYQNAYTDYVTLSPPSNGWSWNQLRNLECRIWIDPAVEGLSVVHVNIYASGDAGGTPLSSTITTIPGGNIIRIVELEVTREPVPSPASVGAQYVYKIYDGDLFVGTLKNVSSEFEYTYGINEAFTQLTVDIVDDLEGAGAGLDKDFIIDESGNNIIDQNGGSILSRLSETFTNVPIDLGNRLKVYEISDTYPEGVIVFDGVISKWRFSAGSTEKLAITVLSHGVQLDNYIFTSPTSSGSIEVATSDSIVNVNGSFKAGKDRLAQTFIPDSDLVVNSITINMYGNSHTTGNPPITFYAKMSVEIIQGTPQSPGSVVGSIPSVSIDVSPASDQTFVFPTYFTINSGDTYHVKLTPLWVGEWAWNDAFTVSYDSTDPYANGTLYKTTDGGDTWTDLGGDMRFRLNTGQLTITPSFSSIQPSSMMKSALDVYASQGGIVAYTSESIEDTGVTASYSFILATYLEAAEVVRKLSPGSWYWYVDPGTSIFYLKQKSGTPDHTFIFGKHIYELNLEKSLENVRNLIYFSGGDTGAGENLLKVVSNTDSLANNGQWLERISDNRVTLDASATLISENTLRDPSYNAEITVLAKDYNIHSIKPGDVVSLANTNEFIQNLNLQVIRLTRRPDSITLYLDSFLPLINKRLEDLKRQLDSVVTINNPSTAS